MMEYSGERVPLFTVEVLPPEGLTKGGEEHSFKDSTIKLLYDTLRTLTNRRAAILKEDILLTYTTRSTGQTAASVRAEAPVVTERGVEASISMASRALPYITTWLGGFVMPPETPIFPAEKPRLVFIGHEGKPVAVTMVTHPGFESDPISQNMAEFQTELSQAVLQVVSRATTQWIDEFGDPVESQALRRQYRYSRPAGR